jgi:O-antigen/teichoic acid export membrane protein
MNRFKSLLRDTLLLGFSDGLSRGAMFFVLLLAARQLGPADYGQLSAVLATTMALGALDLGVATWLLRELVADPTIAKRSIQDAIGTSLAVAAVVVLASVVLSLAAFSSAGLVFTALGASAYATALTVGNVLYATDRSRRRYKPLIIGSMMEKAALVAIAIPAALTRSLPLFGAAYFAGAVVRIGFVSWVYRSFRPWHSLVTLRPLVAVGTLRRSLPFGLNSMLVSTIGRLDMLIVTILAGAVATGFFSLGDKLVSLGISMASVLSLAVMPIFGRGRREDAQFAERVALTALVAGWAGVAAISIWGWPVIEAAFGPSYAAAKGAVLVMLWAIPLVYATAILTPAAYLLNGESQLLRRSAVASAIGLVAVVVGSVLFGVEGAAVGFVVRQVVLFGVILLFVRSWSARSHLGSLSSATGIALPAPTLPGTE